ncbi:Trafficking protein particle complex subunit 33 [Coelomomyces lativittatus]|nr:Trafficking protein particle complex subunit 33 [Coelomomyces lativittatus]KAJ1505130.1 Trafficking protein particle complex subunit 33 [Coelomomyces lativittatus]KAJ1517456.1 Trafficking protein particle complex subunit 33 [Coelomomyces lativittatus]
MSVNSNSTSSTSTSSVSFTSAPGVPSTVSVTTGANVATVSTLSNVTPRPIAESVFHYLGIEMVQSLTSTLSNPKDREVAYYKLEIQGFHVGLRLIENLAKDHPRFKDTLEMVKFICKEFWIAVFHKQVDNLRTNHRGVYVLQDNQFRWFQFASNDQAISETTRAMTPYLWFPCGLIRGALAGLGVLTVVMAESSGIPQCTFQVKITQPE